MSDRNKLAVIDTIGEAFAFAFRKLPSLLVLYLTTFIFLLMPIGFVLYLTLFGQIIELPPPGKKSSPEEISAFILVFVPFMLIIMTAVFGLYSVLIDLITRNVIFQERLWLIRLNKNTVRVFGASLLYAIISLAMLIFAVLMVEGGAQGISQQWSDNLQGPIEASVIVLAIIITIYVIIRFSLVPTAVAAEQKFTMSDGLKATKGNVIRLFFFYLFITVATFVISIIAQLGLSPILSLDPSLTLAQVETPNKETSDMSFTMLKDMYSSPSFMTYWALLTITQVFQIGITFGASAMAYGKLTGKLAIESPTDHLGSVALD